MTRTAPYTVWIFVAVVVTVLSMLAVRRIDAWLVGGGLLLLVASFGLVAGVWPAWLALVVVTAGDLVALLSMGPAWWPLAVNGGC